MPPIDKVVVSNRSALASKYAAAHLPDIDAALQQLVQKDQQRGMTTRVVWLDQADAGLPSDARVSAQPFGTPITDATRTAYARAVRAVHEALSPAYVLLLGAADVVPHQHVPNPVFDPAHPDIDPDREVATDLPYAASSAVLGQSGIPVPDRVVGRLPDLTGRHGTIGRDHLVGLLKTAADQPVRAPHEYREVLAISTAVWQKATRATLESVLGAGAAAALRLSPTDGPRWTEPEMGRALHFINCHGEKDSAVFFGEGPDGRPRAHHSQIVLDRAKPGTLVVAECCYGTQLFDPSLTDDSPGIAEAYLRRGACGVFGSTSLSFSPAERNGFADLMCAEFLRRVLAGASTGRATLEARQAYLAQHPVLTPIDAKTLLQFVLLGDPSMHPSPAGAVAGGPVTRGAAPAAGMAVAGDRARRRQDAIAEGRRLATDAVTAVQPTDEPPTPAVQAAIDRLVRRFGLQNPSVRRFAVPDAGGAETPARREAPRRTPSSACYVIGGRRGPRTDSRAVVLTALERGGRLTRVRLASGSQRAS